MGRWVRWFGAEQGTPGGAAVAKAPPPSAGKAGTRVMTVSRAQAVEVAQGRIGMAPAPTGQISLETLPAEMLTAVLVEEGALDRDKEHLCLQEHRTTGRPVEEVICDSAYVAESELMSILSRRCKVPHLSLERYQIKDQVLESVPADFARANRIMPLERLGKVLNVATSNPLNYTTFKRLEEETGLKVKPVLATPRELSECIDKHYPPPEIEREPETQEDSFRVSAKDLFKSSWLGSIDERGEPGEAAAAEPEGAGAAAEEAEAPAPPEGARPVPLTEEEADAFVKTSAVVLLDTWILSVGAVGTTELSARPGAAGGGARALAALPVSEAEFGIIVADDAAPVARSEDAKAESATRTSKRRSARKKSRKKRKKRSGR